MTITYRVPTIYSMYFDFSFDTFNINNGISVGTFPIGCRIVGGDMFIVTPFNAAGVNTLTVGTFGGATEYFTAAETVATVAGRKPLISGINQNPFTIAKGVVLRCQMTGTAATAGRGIMSINWIAQ